MVGSVVNGRVTKSTGSAVGATQREIGRNRLGMIMLISGTDVFTPSSHLAFRAALRGCGVLDSAP